MLEAVLKENLLVIKKTQDLRGSSSKNNLDETNPTQNLSRQIDVRSNKAAAFR